MYVVACHIVAYRVVPSLDLIVSIGTVARPPGGSEETRQKGTHG